DAADVPARNTCPSTDSNAHAPFRHVKLTRSPRGRPCAPRRANRESGLRIRQVVAGAHRRPPASAVNGSSMVSAGVLAAFGGCEAGFRDATENDQSWSVGLVEPDHIEGPCKCPVAAMQTSIH